MGTDELHGGCAELPDALFDYFARSGVALTLSAADGDVPLLLVNDAFCKLTGYSQEEAIGLNCRFLQGEDTSDQSRADIHDYIYTERSRSVGGGRFSIRNYRKDGTAFSNLLFLNRLTGDDGKAKFIIGSQFNMSAALPDRKLKENDRELGKDLSHISAVGSDFGLVMMGAAKTLADSHAIIAASFLDESPGAAGPLKK